MRAWPEHRHSESAEMWGSKWAAFNALTDELRKRKDVVLLEDE